ncbi:hypothetical protein [Pseudomonas sp. P108]|uniref:hypothetical protein n=1 Tax=Pseudomonas sp. P108 TaxID=1837993 RepID=UPI002934C587|nr:hypothetical protein [Pseudomonas sp. P108]WNZ84223.1 hypothetical protein QOM10_28735 [Pseudomonas sp. P108]
MKKLGLIALLLCSFSVAAEPMFPSLKSCRDADGDCALALKDNFLVDAKSGQRISEEAEPAGMMSGFWLYRDGDRYILKNENYSQAKSRRWLVFTYDSGKVVLDGAYIFSIDIDPNTGPYWHGYDCRGDAKPFAVPTKEPFSDVALEALCGGAEGWVVSGKDKAVPVSAKGLAVSVPVYHARNRDGSATYLFTESDVPDLSKLVCLSNCADANQVPERVSQETAPLQGGQDGTLCSAEEDIYFSCPLTGGKTVSVCAQGNNKPTAGYVQYRYGVPGKIEMLYPQKNVPPKGKFFVVDASEGSVNLNNIKFKKGPYTYLVNQAFVSFLTVLKDDNVVFRQSCSAGGYSFVSRVARQGIEALPKSAEDFR